MGLYLRLQVNIPMRKEDADTLESLWAAGAQEGLDEAKWERQINEQIQRLIARQTIVLIPNKFIWDHDIVYTRKEDA